MDGEGAGVDIAHRIDQAHHPAGSAQVETRKGVAVGGQVEEGVTGQHVFTMGHQPVVELALLGGRRMQLIPYIGTPARGPQAGEAELGPVAVGDGLEGVELGDVVAGDDDREFEPGEPGGKQALHSHHGGGERALAPHGVVDLGGGAVQGDLHVDVVASGQSSGHRLGDPRAVGRELHPYVVLGGVVDQLPEVGANGGLAPADVDVEDLHALELVDERLALVGRELARVTPARARQTVHAGQVAGVGELPGEADGGVEATLKAIDEPGPGGGEGSHATRSQIMPDSASAPKACS